MQKQGWGPAPPNHLSPQGHNPQPQPTRAPAKSGLVWKLIGALFFLMFVFRATQTSLAIAILIAASALAVLVAVALGLWVSSAPAVTRAIAGWARRWPNFVAIVFPSTLIGAFMGAAMPKQNADTPMVSAQPSRPTEPAPRGASPSSKSAEPSPAVEVPSYELAQDLDLAPKNGRSILVNVRDPDLTDAQCVAIVDRLRPRAGPEGQVAVRIPLHNDRPENHAGVPASEQIRFFPLCYDNLDGKGVQEGTARQMQRAFDKKPGGRGGR